MALVDKSNGTTEVTRTKHEIIMDKLYELRRSVSEIENLLDRISPQAQTDSSPKYVASDSLADVLSDLPNELDELTERIHKAVDSINNKLF